MYEWHTYGGGMMWIFWILIVVLLVWLVVAAMRPKEESGERKSARDILDERYARGEIEREEYQRKRADLES